MGASVGSSHGALGVSLLLCLVLLKSFLPCVAYKMGIVGLIQGVGSVILRLVSLSLVKSSGEGEDLGQGYSRCLCVYMFKVISLPALISLTNSEAFFIKCKLKIQGWT